MPNLTPESALHEAGESYTDEKVPSLAGRLRYLRARAGLTQEQLAELVETSQANINRWENGKTTPRQIMLGKLAAALGASINWIVSGSDAPTSTKIPVIGYVAAEEDEHCAVYPFDDFAKGDGLYEVDAPVILDDGYVALEIRGHSQEPVYRDRDIIIYRRDGDFILEQCLGRMCIVKLQDGRLLIKEVKRSQSAPMKYDLHSFNRDPIPAQSIQWAAPIRVHLPR